MQRPRIEHIMARFAELDGRGAYVPVSVIPKLVEYATLQLITDIVKRNPLLKVWHEKLNIQAKTFYGECIGHE